MNAFLFCSSFQQRWEREIQVVSPSGVAAVVWCSWRDSNEGFNEGDDRLSLMREARNTLQLEQVLMQEHFEGKYCTRLSSLL